jgi:hypothetical protein
MHARLVTRKPTPLLLLARGCSHRSTGACLHRGIGAAFSKAVVAMLNDSRIREYLSE